MNYQQTLHYLYSRLPMFHRIGAAAYKADLSNTLALSNVLGNPEKSFKSIHIAGTNGKGSTSHFLASVLQEAGFKTGLFTSPHLKDFRERIKINGTMISKKDVVSFVKHYQPDFDPVIIGETHVETKPVFEEFAEKHNSEITFADQQMILIQHTYTAHRPALLQAEYQSLKTNHIYKVKSPLSGKYQIKNLATALTAIENLQQVLTIKQRNVLSGIQKVVKNTHLMGRWQTLSLHPLTIADIGHNPDGIREVLEQLALTPYQKLHFVIGVVNDKDVKGMLQKLPKDAWYYFCKANIPRGLDAAELSMLANEFSLHGSAYESVAEALQAAQTAAGSKDLVMVGGSAFVVAEVV